MYNKLRVKFLNWRMKRRIVTDENYPEHKKDMKEILERVTLSISGYEYVIATIKEDPDIPDHMKADIVVTVRSYMQKQPVYRLLKELEHSIS